MKLSLFLLSNNFLYESSEFQIKIAECHVGYLNDSNWGRRINGEGTIAEQIKSTMDLAKNKYLPDRKMPVLDASNFLQLKNPQLRMF